MIILESAGAQPNALPVSTIDLAGDRTHRSHGHMLVHSNHQVSGASLYDGIIFCCLLIGAC